MHDAEHFEEQSRIHRFKAMARTAKNSAEAYTQEVKGTCIGSPGRSEIVRV